MPEAHIDCWIVTEGIAGTENQCTGIAAALGVEPVIKRIALRHPWKALSPYIGGEQSWTFDPPLLPPWPDLLIAGGRKGIAAARYIKKASGGKTFTVFIQDPRVNPAQFDLVIVPEHDPAHGPNVVVTTASPNRVTEKILAAEKEKFLAFEKLKSPRVAVMIGGDSKAHRLTQSVMQQLVNQLKSLDAGLMITASRRTGKENLALLESFLAKVENVYLWDGEGENPYFALLAWADYIIVTNDSVSMLSEAATTGKPIYMVELEGGSPRLNRFHRNLVDKGIARIFNGKLENWSYNPLRDAERAAKEIEKRLLSRR